MDGKRSPYTIIGYKESMRQFAIFAEEEKHLGESDFGLDFLLNQMYMNMLDG